MLTKFTVLTQLNSWSAAPWPQPGKLDAVVKRERERETGERKKKSKNQRERKTFCFEGEKEAE